MSSEFLEDGAGESPLEPAQRPAVAHADRARCQSEQPGRLADTIAAHMSLQLDEKQKATVEATAKQDASPYPKSGNIPPKIVKISAAEGKEPGDNKQ